MKKIKPDFSPDDDIDDDEFDNQDEFNNEDEECDDDYYDEEFYDEEEEYDDYQEEYDQYDDNDEYDDDEEIGSSIAGMIGEARKKLFIPVAEKYSDYGVYDGEVERQWRNVVIMRVLSAFRFNNKDIKRRVNNWW
jgi:hypothetical protein